MKSPFLVLLASTTLLLVGCRAPGTYVSIDRPFDVVRENIESFASHAVASDPTSTGPVARAAGDRWHPPLIIGETDRTTDALPTILGTPINDTRTNLPYRGRQKIVCVRTNDVPGRTFQVTLLDYSMLNSFGTPWTEIEAIHSGRDFTTLRIYCTLHDGTSLSRMNRNQQWEAETLVRLCNSMGYVP